MPNVFEGQLPILTMTSFCYNYQKSFRFRSFSFKVSPSQPQLERRTKTFRDLEVIC